VNTFFFPEILQGISKIVEKHGYFLVFLQSDNSFEKEKELIEYCIQMFVDGVLISIAADTTNLDHLLKLRKMDASVVLIDRIIVNDEIPFLTIDDTNTAFKAIDYLVSKGHTNILGIFDDSRLSMTKLRMVGYQLGLEKNGLQFDPKKVLIVTSEDSIEKEILKLLDEETTATAVFTMSDKLMVKAYYAINSLGFKIPDDFALISISDGKAPHYLYPGITHIRHSGEVVGEAAANLLFKMLDGEKQAGKLHVVDTTLIELGSV
jgi:LacI family transcriptional regulator